MSEKLEFVLGILNGAVGDYLARAGNELATAMGIFKNGSALRMERAAFTTAYPDATPRVAVLVHGLMCTESIWKFADGSDYGSLLARDLHYTPIYVRYNSGLSIPENGLSLAALLESLTEVYPVKIEEILLLGYSMGGLVVRNACHHARLAQRPWLQLVQNAIYIGTPHRGAPMERAGRVLTKLLHQINDPYVKLIAQIGDLRSSGVKDLGDPQHPITLLPEIRHYLLAGSVLNNPHISALFGDAVVPLHSATDGHHGREGSEAAKTRVKILNGVGHVALARHPDAYAQIRAWCEEPACAT